MCSACPHRGGVSGDALGKEVLQGSISDETETATSQLEKEGYTQLGKKKQKEAIKLISEYMRIGGSKKGYDTRIALTI